MENGFTRSDGRLRREYRARGAADVRYSVGNDSEEASETRASHNRILSPKSDEYGGESHNEDELHFHQLDELTGTLRGLAAGGANGSGGLAVPHQHDQAAAPEGVARWPGLEQHQFHDVSVSVIFPLYFFRMNAPASRLGYQ
jgi:hypothetical protein